MIKSKYFLKISLLFLSLLAFSKAETGNYHTSYTDWLAYPGKAGEYAPPTANDVTLVQCDTNPIDGFSSFDLTHAIPEITDEAVNVTVSFFLSMVNAQNNIMPVNASNFTNTINPQILYARVQDTQGPDFAISQVTLQVQDNIANPANINVCDDDGNIDGFHSFTLSDANPTILSGLAGVYTVTYYTTLTNALLESNPLPNNYININPYTQQIRARVENGADCFDIVTVLLAVITPPVLAPDGNIIYCLNDFPATVALDSGIMGADGTETYLWSTGDVTPSIDVNTPGAYTVTVTNFDGCSSTRTLNVTGSEPATFNSVNVTNCTVSNNSINVNVSGQGVYEYALNNIAGPYQNSNQFNNLAAGNYTVYVRDQNGCGTVQQNVSIYPPIPIAADEEIIYCLNTFPATINLSSGILGGDGTETFLWSTGAVTQNIDINTPGEYTVIISNLGGCSASRTITVLPSGTATFQPFQVSDFSDNNTITVFVTGEGDYEYALNNLAGPYQDSNQFNNVPAGIYTVYVRDQNGCGTVQQEIVVAGYPKFFTPNGDGINDTWQLMGAGGLFQPNSRIFIFDRYGKLIAQLTPASSWDGTYNGRPLPSSDYWFRIQLEDGRDFKGHFTLKR